MGQPAPHVPPNLALSSDSAHLDPIPKVEREHIRVAKSALHPPPLFRSVGLTGLSASLPPHRRLRPVLHRARAVLPANANDTMNEANAWPQTPRSSPTTNTPGDSERGLPSKGRTCPSSRMDSATYKDSLPHIATHRLRPCHEIRPCREGQVREPNVLTLASSQAQADRCKHVHLRPNISLSNKMLIPASTVHKRSNAGHNPPPKTHRRRSMVSPFQQDNVPTDGLGKRTERWGRSKINNTGPHGHSEQHLTPEKGQEDNMCQWLSSLGITDRDKERSERLRGASRQRSKLGEKEARPTRRDRRPHFLPPISQSDCLLNVPLVLPENSPPPSPSCVSSTPFFPLHVPTLPLWTEHRLKHT